MTFEPTVSIDGIIALASFTAIGIGGWYGVVRRVDRHAAQIAQLRTDHEDLRRGRGLILEHWPPRVRQCFGWMRGEGS